MSLQNPQINSNDEAINSFDSAKLTQILSVEKQILDGQTKNSAKEGYIAKQTGFLRKIITAVGFLCILSISLTGALIAQNVENKDSNASAIYSCVVGETLVGTDCISPASSYPVYGEGCPTGYITMQSVCAKVEVKTCADFSKAIVAEAGLCKVDSNNVLLSEVTDSDGRTCNGNGYNFKRYNVDLPLNSFDGPVVCASAFSAVFGKENFRFIPSKVLDIKNFTTSQTGSTTVPCLTGYKAIENNTKCSRPATIIGCNAGGEYLTNFNFFGTITANAQTFTNTQTTTITANNATNVTANTNDDYVDNFDLDLTGGSKSSSSRSSSSNNSSSLARSSVSVSSSSIFVPTQNIAQLASTNGNLGTLAAALDKAELTSVFSGSDKLTVLAPSNSAFAKIPAATLNLLLKPENKETLVKILKYHVIGSEVRASDIVKLSEATTLEGSKVTISVQNDKVVLNTNVNVVSTDTLATNGVIHIIDTVLIPSSVNLSVLKDNSVSTSSSTATSVVTPAPVQALNLSCKPCPAGQYCPINATASSTIKVCANGGVLTGDKCIGQNKITTKTFTDGCSSEYVKLDQTCAIIEVRTHDLGCSYYYASDDKNILAVLDGTRCSTGGRTDFASTSIVKASDLQCDGPDSAWYNYNVAYDPLVCGKGDPANKTAFRWSVNSFTKIVGLQKLAANTQVCPESWTAINVNDCYQLVLTQEYKARNDCPVNTYCPEGSVTPIACPANTTSPAKSTKLGDCVAVVTPVTPTTTGGGVITISTGTSSVTAASSTVVVTTPVVCTSKPGEYFTNGACVPCIAGYYCPGGSNAPIICPVGYYCPPASATPTICPVGTTTVGQGSKVLDDCKAIAKPAPTSVRSGGLQVFVAIFSTLSLLFFGYLYLSSKNAKGAMASDWIKIK
jgi:uncharacterized surface protein with fasciclin (FAS1) repeats